MDLTISILGIHTFYPCLIQFSIIEILMYNGDHNTEKTMSEGLIHILQQLCIHRDIELLFCIKIGLT